MRLLAQVGPKLHCKRVVHALEPVGDIAVEAREFVPGITLLRARVRSGFTPHRLVQVFLGTILKGVVNFQNHGPETPEIQCSGLELG